MLQGLLGNDVLSGGGGADQFWFHNAGPLNTDTVTDFSGVDDTIVLQAAFFTALAGSIGNPLDAANFVLGAAAADSNDYIIYDSGNLYYDADGSGGTAALQIATLTGAPTLAAADFMIVA